ncbi:hypothetical protein KAJ27_07310 [bacterium]|nr:hypothetical protein [bacterium]
MDLENNPTFGFCEKCQTYHSLGYGNAKLYARQVMDEFDRIKRLDYLVTEEQSEYTFSFDYLLGSYERGHMFGVLECLNEAGEVVVLRAFSSLYMGIRKIDGWVPPILSDDVYYNLLIPGESEIKTLTKELKHLSPDTDVYKDKKKLRSQNSQKLIKELQMNYTFQNFNGESKSLLEIFPSEQGIPGGVGDCCAPKLLGFAVENNLKPVGIAEFYWGGKSSSKVHGEFYPSCKSRCQPILGFLLCGLNHD